MKKLLFIIFFMIASVTPVCAEEQTADQPQTSVARICFSMSSAETQSFTVYDSAGIPVTISVISSVSGEKHIQASNAMIQMSYYIYTASSNIVSAYNPGYHITNGNVTSSSLVRNSDKKATYTVTCKRFLSTITYKLVSEIRNDQLVVSFS